MSAVSGLFPARDGYGVPVRMGSTVVCLDGAGGLVVGSVAGSSRRHGVVTVEGSGGEVRDVTAAVCVVGVAVSEVVATGDTVVCPVDVVGYAPDADGVLRPHLFHCLAVGWVHRGSDGRQVMVVRDVLHGDNVMWSRAVFHRFDGMVWQGSRPEIVLPDGGVGDGRLVGFRPAGALGSVGVRYWNRVDADDMESVEVNGE